jgi:hypothetical protein
VFAGLQVARLDLAAEVLLLIGVEQGNLVDLDQIGLQTAFGRDSSSS